MSERPRITPAVTAPIAPVTPYRVCPQCGAQSHTTEASCPHCGRGYAVRKKWPWVVLAIALAMFVGFVGCIAVVGPTVNINTDPLSAQQVRHAISKEQFDAVTIGVSRAAVINQLGKQPQTGKALEDIGVLKDTAASRCIYYNRTDGFSGEAYQFCFTNGALASKAAV